MQIKKEQSRNLYYVDDALEFIILNKLNWKEISNYFEEDLMLIYLILHILIVTKKLNLQ